ncbi:ABC transporter permease, partial [Aeromonas veronii]
AIIIKEFQQLARDRMTFAMIVMIPLVQLMLFGYAINTDVRQLPAGLVDLSGSSQGRALVQAIEASQVVHFTRTYA